jgi:hypothetical protein
MIVETHLEPALCAISVPVLERWQRRIILFAGPIRSQSDDAVQHLGVANAVSKVVAVPATVSLKATSRLHSLMGAGVAVRHGDAASSAVYGVENALCAIVYSELQRGVELGRTASSRAFCEDECFCPACPYLATDLLLQAKMNVASAFQSRTVEDLAARNNRASAVLGWTLARLTIRI